METRRVSEDQHAALVYAAGYHFGRLRVDWDCINVPKTQARFSPLNPSR